jgi:outer membrane lipoprotein SlyB
MKRIAFAIAILLSLSACAGRGNEFIGTGVGGALGGWAGSTMGRGSGNLAATAGGGLLGAWIGNSIGSSMDRVDAMGRRY